MTVLEKQSREYPAKALSYVNHRYCQSVFHQIILVRSHPPEQNGYLTLQKQLSFNFMWKKELPCAVTSSATEEGKP